MSAVSVNTQGFESFVMRCPREVTPHLTLIINVALQHIRYDPNYSYGDDEDGDDDVDMDGEEDEEVTPGPRMTTWGAAEGGVDCCSLLVFCLFFTHRYAHVL